MDSPPPRSLHLQKGKNSTHALTPNWWKEKIEKTAEQINALIQLRYNENMQFQQKNAYLKSVHFRTSKNEWIYQWN